MHATIPSRLRSAEPIGARLRESLVEARTSSGESLWNLSQRRPTLVVFLRHAGCTFCREALHDIAIRRRYIERQGVQVVLVHMSDETHAAKFFPTYGVGDLPRVADPQQELYRAFDLLPARWWQIMGAKVLLRGLWTALVRGYGFGKTVGDLAQMPGIFLISKGQILNAYRHRTAADRPDYVGLSACGAPLAQAN